MTLQEIFPDVPAGTLDDMLLSSQDINEVANSLADTTSNTHEPEFPNINNNRRHRLSVEEDSILEDSFCYYKSKDFDPETPLRIAFKGQDAIDAGGPLRQFFTLVVDRIATRFFEDGSTNLVPTINANTIISEIFVVVGKIIAHSIVHGCSGFPYLARVTYHYICSGNIMDAACYVTLNQVANSAYQHYIKEVLTLIIQNFLFFIFSFVINILSLCFFIFTVLFSTFKITILYCITIEGNSFFFGFVRNKSSNCLKRVRLK